MPRPFPVQQAGILKDVKPGELPPDKFSDGQNVIFQDGRAWRSLGYLSVFSPDVAPYYLLPVQQAVNYYWIYPGQSAIYVTNGTADFNITPAAAFSDGHQKRWTGGMLNGVPILNIDSIDPVYWDGNTSNIMVPLPGWPANTKIKGALRPYRNFMIAMDLEETSVRKGTKYRWSDAAPENALPTTWTASDTNAAGSGLVGADDGFIIDGAQLYQDFFMYKQHSIYRLSFIGGRFVLAEQPVSGVAGALTQNCIATVKLRGTLERHIVLTDGDVIAMDGRTPDTIADKQVRRFIQNEINPDALEKAFVVPYLSENQVWICIPTADASFPNLALVWNYRDNQWGFRDLPESPAITPGLVSLGVAPDELWSDLGNWDTLDRVWDQRSFNPTDTALLMTDPTSTKLQAIDYSNQADGVNIESYVERKHIQMRPDRGVATAVHAYPRMEGIAGTQVTFMFGHSDSTRIEPQYDQTKVFTIGTDDRLDFFSKGKYLSYRIDSNGENPWELAGIDFELEDGGRF